MATYTLAITEKDIELALVKGGGCPVQAGGIPMIDISVTPPLGNVHGGGDTSQTGLTHNRNPR